MEGNGDAGGNGAAARAEEQQDRAYFSDTEGLRSTDSGVSYGREHRVDWDAAIDDLQWVQAVAGFEMYTKTFDCPRCGDTTQVEYYLSEHPAGALGFNLHLQTMPPPKVIGGKVVLERACACDVPHPPGVKGCGAQFLITPPTGSRP